MRRETRRTLVLGAAGAMAAGMIFPGCMDRNLLCEETLTCPSEGGSGGESGTGGGSPGGGGGSSGGSAGSSLAGSSTGGTGGRPWCEESCAGSAGQCEGPGCEECREDEECGEGEQCDEVSGECVECLFDGDCEDAELPACLGKECKGCQEHAQCARFEARSLCFQEPGEEMSGSCVECLSDADCGGHVCNPQTHECTELPVQALPVCAECVHDAECQEGQLCVEQEKHGHVGSYCTWTKAALVGEGSCIVDGRPFAGFASLTSTDGATADLCVLATTTCPAFLDHRQPLCSGPEDDASCGAPGANDALCELKSSTYLCTYPCGSDVDCATGFSCTVGDKYCSL